MSVNSKMTAIADAIRNLLDISGTMGLDAMASNISSIAKRGAVAGTISTKAEQYIIPAGYHNGNGTVGIDDAEQAKIIAENIKNGVTILGVAGSASGEIYSIIAVTYPEGSVCTCSNGTKTLKARDTSGKALFNVTVGEWTVSCTDGSQTASKTVSITEEGQSESVALTFFAATIRVTYPAGSTCTATDGVTTLTAPDTSGTWECVVPNAGTWTASLSNGFSEAITISENGETQTLNKWYLYNRGDERTYITGGIRALVHPTYGGTVEKNTDNIYFGGTLNYSKGAAISTANSIDLSGFSKLCFDMTYVCSSNNYPEIGVKQSPAYSVGNWTVIKGLNSTGLDATVDIQSVSSGYPYVNAWASNATVYEIWLEV